MGGFAPITLGRALRVVESASFVFTETAHEAGTVLPPHAHRHHALSFVIAGRRSHRFDTVAIDCAVASMTLVPAGAVHSSRFDGPAARGLMVELRGASIAAGESTAALFSAPRVCAGAAVTRSLEAIRRELRAADAVSALALECQGLELLVGAERTRAAAANRPPRWLVRAREALHDDPGALPRLAELAAVAGVHPAHLTREFRRHFGSSIGEYARALRVARAAELVDAGERSLAEIARLCGFADQSHLTRAFRAAYGVTPGARRRGGPRRAAASGLAPIVQDRGRLR